MAITFKQTDTAASHSEQLMCSSGPVNPDTNASKEISADGTYDLTEDTLIINGQAVGNAVVFMESASGEPGQTTWAAGDWSVSLYVTTGANKVNWYKVYICRCTSAGVNISTVGSLANAQEIENPGVYTISGINGVEQNANAGDRVYVVCLFDNENHGDATFGITFDQDVISPIIAGGPTIVQASVATATFSVKNPAVLGKATVTPSVATATFSVLGPVVTGKAVATPSVATASFSVLTPAVTGKASVTPSAATATFTVLTPTVDTGGGAVEVEVAVATATFTALTPTVSGKASAQVSAATSTFSVQTPIVLGKATATPSVAAATFSVKDPTVLGKALIQVAVATATFSVQDPTILGKALATPSVATATFTVQDPIVSGKAKAFPTVAAATFSIQDPVVLGKALCQVAVATATFSVLTPTVSITVTAQVSVATATFSVPAPTVLGKATATPSVATATFTVLTPTVTTGGETVVEVTVATATFTVNSPTISGADSAPGAGRDMYQVFSTVVPFTEADNVDATDLSDYSVRRKNIPSPDSNIIPTQWVVQTRHADGKVRLARAIIRDLVPAGSTNEYDIVELGSPPSNPAFDWNPNVAGWRTASSPNGILRIEVKDCVPFPKRGAYYIDLDPDSAPSWVTGYDPASSPWHAIQSFEGWLTQSGANGLETHRSDIRYESSRTPDPDGLKICRAVAYLHYFSGCDFVQVSCLVGNNRTGVHIDGTPDTTDPDEWPLPVVRLSSVGVMFNNAITYDGAVVDWHVDFASVYHAGDMLENQSEGSLHDPYAEDNSKYTWHAGSGNNPDGNLYLTLARQDKIHALEIGLKTEEEKALRYPVKYESFTAILGQKGMVAKDYEPRESALLLPGGSVRVFKFWARFTQAGAHGGIARDDTWGCVKTGPYYGIPTWDTAGTTKTLSLAQTHTVHRPFGWHTGSAWKSLSQEDAARRVHEGLNKAYWDLVGGHNGSGRHPNDGNGGWLGGWYEGSGTHYWVIHNTWTGGGWTNSDFSGGDHLAPWFVGANPKAARICEFMGVASSFRAINGGDKEWDDAGSSEWPFNAYHYGNSTLLWFDRSAWSDLAERAKYAIASWIGGRYKFGDEELCFDPCRHRNRELFEIVQDDIAGTRKTGYFSYDEQHIWPVTYEAWVVSGDPIWQYCLRKQALYGLASLQSRGPYADSEVKAPPWTSYWAKDSGFVMNGTRGVIPRVFAGWTRLIIAGHYAIWDGSAGKDYAANRALEYIWSHRYLHAHQGLKAHELALLDDDGLTPADYACWQPFHEYHAWYFSHQAIARGTKGVDDRIGLNPANCESAENWGASWSENHGTGEPSYYFTQAWQCGYAMNVVAMILCATNSSTQFDWTHHSPPESHNTGWTEVKDWLLNIIRHFALGQNWIHADGTRVVSSVTGHPPKHGWPVGPTAPEVTWSAAAGKFVKAGRFNKTYFCKTPVKPTQAGTPWPAYFNMPPADYHGTRDVQILKNDLVTPESVDLNHFPAHTVSSFRIEDSEWDPPWTIGKEAKRRIPVVNNESLCTILLQDHWADTKGDTDTSYWYAGVGAAWQFADAGWKTAVTELMKEFVARAWYGRRTDTGPGMPLGHATIAHRLFTGSQYVSLVPAADRLMQGLGDIWNELFA